MGVDIQTYRARIGTYTHSRCDETIGNYRQSSGCNVAVTDIYVSNGLKTVGCVFFICVLLIIAGIEQNPGPVEKGSECCQNDEVDGVVKGAEMRADDTAHKLYHAESTRRIKITGLMEHMNKQMLKMFFDEEERNGGGKVIAIDIDNTNKCAIVEFEDETGVDLIMKKTPVTICGMQVHIEVPGDETEKPKMIKISKLPANINKDMLLMFFENKIECNGKVVSVTVNTKDSYAIVEFDKSAAVYGVMAKQPLAIFGFTVEVDTFVPETSLVKSQDIPRIRISGLKENTNKEILTMYFEHEERKGGGKVKNIEMDQKGTLATVDFEEKAGADAFMLRNPKSILGMDVTVEVIDTSSDKSRGKSTRIKITGLAENTNKEMLEMFFEREERKGGGKVKHIFIDGQNKCAVIEYEDETGFESIMNKTPMTIFGMEVGIETLDDIDEPKKIQITNMPVIVNQEILKMFFENKTDFGGKIIDINFISEENRAIVEFDDSTAVYRIIDERPMTILGYDVNVDVFDSSVVVEPQNIPRIRISGLNENTNNEMLALYFEHEERKGGGKVKNIELHQRGTFAIIEFKEKAGADAFLLKNPKSILGMNVTIELIDTTSDTSRTKSTRIKITGLAENTNKEMLEMFFETEERNGGGKVNNIYIDGKNKCAVIEFKDESGVEWIMNRTPMSILGMEVGIETPDAIDQSKKIQITNFPVIINKEMMKMFFESKRDFGGKIIDIRMKSEENKAIVEFDDSTAVYRIMDAQPLKILGFDVDVDVFEDKDYSDIKPGERGMQRAESLQTTGTEQDSSHKYGSAVAETADSNPVERLDSSKSRASAETEGQIFYQILQQLGLTDKFPGKISMQDVIAVTPNESIEQVNEKISLADIPWLILKRLISAHSECRDITMSKEQSTESSLKYEDSISPSSERPHDNQDISPLDIFTVVFQCCDPSLKQIFVQNLYLCKLAVPFFYSFWETNEQHTPIISVWPLRSLAIENNQKYANKNEKHCRESDVLELPTKVLAFGRLGRPRYSKSKLINSLLLSEGCKTFFNMDCPSGKSPRQLSNGQIEMFLLPTIDERKDRFQDAMTFLNLRGDLCKHFSTDILYFTANFVDSIVMIVDLDMVLNQSKKVEDVLLQFSSVILIIADPLNPDAVRFVKKFQSGVISSKSEISLRILSTHKGTVEQNVVDMLSGMTKNISEQLKINKTKSFEERLSQANLATIKTDEEDVVCQKGKLEATTLIKQMKTDGEPSGWKTHLTPVQSNLSKQLGMLLKKRERERDLIEVGKIDVKIIEVRRKQIASITNSVKCFLYLLIKNSNCPLILKYFLSWLHFYIEREKRQILPRLMHAHRSAWEKLKSLKYSEKFVHGEIIETQETVITDLEEQIDGASFTVQHFFREIGHINEAILELKEDSTKLGLPTLHQMSNIVSRLLLDGYHFELIDGESFYMPYQWIKTVLKNVDISIGSSKVMTLSVLGLQSSGKSTLLNRMFGSNFSSRSGRCTRGIHVQLIPMKGTHFGETSEVFSYVLIVDTEGLRSPELSNVQHEHDNELATVITGVGDITMLNIMGENPSEMRDVLQVVVHAFLRLKMTNEKLDIRKSCAFIHQNVSDTFARENMISGLSKLMQTLDEMTYESARSLGIINITTFNQVIEFDIRQVWYLKNLWQGNPPMAKINNGYSECVVDIKCKILEKASTLKDKSYKPLTDIVEHAHDLWKGVLNEDFVFSFRSSLEIEAYMEMESVVHNELWRLESLIREKLLQISQNSFAKCDQKENLRNVADSLISELYEILLDEKIKTEENIKKYFEGNKFKDIVIQWKSSQQHRVTMLFEKLQQIIKEHVEKSQVKRSLEILTVHCQGKHEEELRKRSMEVANAHKGQKLNSEKIDQLFGEIWKEFLNKVDTSSTGTEKHRKKMKNIFRTCLENIFKQSHALLKQALKDTDFLTPLPNVKQLANSFSDTGINESDISFTIVQKGKAWLGFSDTMKYVGTRVNQIFESVDGKIKELCQVNDEITEMSVNKLMHELDISIQGILSADCKYSFKVPFYVKIYVHVSRHAHTIFESHNEKYVKTHGTAVLLERYRVQQKISFESHLKCRHFEDLVAELFSHVIESFAEEWTFQSLPNKVTESLMSLLPNVKNRVIIEICTDLLEEGKFENFVRYIDDPHSYATLWITKKANQFLFDSEFQVVTSISSLLLKDLFRSVCNCVNGVLREYDRKSSPSIDTWIKSFQNSMKSLDFSIPSESFRNVRKETSSNIQNVEYLTTKILDYLGNSEKKLASKLKSQKSHTITWSGYNPISRIIKKIWGCKEQCVFCGEPCAKNQDHDGSTHYSIQHRPSCCRGVCIRTSQNACLASCEFDIQSNARHMCSVFNYICNSGKREECGKHHYYRDYKTYLPDWDIAPTSNMHDASKFWIWFVVTYKGNLEKLYGYKIEDIPSTWNTITKSEAKESLHKIYSA
ncbi:interferon-induced very large GTPase 1-like [Ruditapes philippinarum]|uniref:interferon-induced very large GTPase 1-like n=1 Tax=Ruditapes philippinarum TaxID=129788 RepID=UPI00295AF3EE|nr:interferon-induced very large GTPase 1-like [Ruditapes philippinarum]XP_060592328.1 interferon-induced very large GTPase 1-like [Ruditapes philippinarum]